MYYYAFNLPRPEGSLEGAPGRRQRWAWRSWAAGRRRIAGRDSRLVVVVGGGGAKLRCDACHSAHSARGAPRQSMSGRRRIAKVGLGQLIVSNNSKMLVARCRGLVDGLQVPVPRSEDTRKRSPMPPTRRDTYSYSVDEQSLALRGR